MSVPSFQLLTVNPEHRFSSLADMQTSPYLADINWDAVYEKKTEAGFVPNVSEKRSDIHALSHISSLSVQQLSDGRDAECSLLAVAYTRTPVVRMCVFLCS